MIQIGKGKVYPSCFYSDALLILMLEWISKESDGEVECGVQHTISAIVSDKEENAVGVSKRTGIQCETQVLCLIP